MRKTFLFNLLVFLLPFTVDAQNDLCVNATTITPGLNCQNVPGSFNGASVSVVGSSCGTTVQDVWYRFVATDPTVSIFLTNSNFVDLGMEIYAQSCGGPSVVCDNSTNNSNEFYMNNNFVVGETYFIRVFHLRGVEITSSFTICLQTYPTPANDLCDNATVLTPNSDCVNTAGSFSGASITSAASTCSPAALQDVWYQFVATDSNMSVSLSNNIGVNLGMEIYQGSCSGSGWVCDDNATNSVEFYQNNNFTVGQTYFVRVFHSESFLLANPFSICVQKYVVPANDLCANATVLTANTSCVTTAGSFTGASITNAASTCSPTALQDVWYQFVATDATMSVLLSNNNNLNMGMEIYQGSCSGSGWVCDDNATNSVEFYQNNNFIVGETYFVRVFHSQNALQAVNFSICIQNYPAPANDLCANATLLTPNSDCVNTAGSFSGASITNASSTCSPAALQDVWYQFIATDANMSVFLSNNNSLNLGMEIYQGSCSGSGWVCDDNATNSAEFYQNNNFIVGETYFVRVFHSQSSLLTVNFSICIQKYPVPANDLCANATVLTPSTSCVNTTGSFSGASITNAASTCSPAALQDVWYQFVATDATMSIRLANNNNLNTGMEIYQGSCSGSGWVCDDNATNSVEFYQNNNFIVGETYFVRVFHSENLLLPTVFSICIQNPTLSVGDMETTDFALYPNPTQDEVNINLRNTAIQEVTIYDVTGQLVLRTVAGTASVDMSNLRSGLYFITVKTTDQRTFTDKIMKL